MKTLKGIVKFIDLGMGGWGFETPEGNRFELIGGSDALLKPGKKAILKGKIRNDLMSSGNFGPIFEVLDAQDDA
jgi:hypothetical protein